MITNTAACGDHLEKSKLYMISLEKLGTVWSSANRPRIVRCPKIRGIRQFFSILRVSTQRQKKEKFIWD